MKLPWQSAGDCLSVQDWSFRRQSYPQCAMFSMAAVPDTGFTRSLRPKAVRACMALVAFARHHIGNPSPAVSDALTEVRASLPCRFQLLLHVSQCRVAASIPGSVNQVSPRAGSVFRSPVTSKSCSKYWYPGHTPQMPPDYVAFGRPVDRQLTSGSKNQSDPYRTSGMNF